MCTDQRRRKLTSSVIVNANDCYIESSLIERLLGAYVHENLKWVEHVQNNKCSVIHSLNARYGALRKVAKFANN